MREDGFELDVTLLDTAPRIWRHIAVSAGETFADVHAVVQVVVGWWSERGRGARERDRVATPRAGTAGSGR